jgi:transposase-like protein
MAHPVFSEPRFHNEEAAFAFVEARLWPNGPVCPYCGGTDRIGRIAGQRIGQWKCYPCQKRFTVRVGWIFEASHLPLHMWLQAIHMLCAGKKGTSTRQIQRVLKCSMKTAWHLTHRIRHAMATEPGAAPIGGEGKTVEADEMFVMNRPGVVKHPGAGGAGHKIAVVSLVERGGQTRSAVLPASPNRYDIEKVMHRHMDIKSRLLTDGAQYYRFPPAQTHETVNHSIKEYVREDVHVNTVEGYFSVFKRGMIGTYQHVSAHHLHRYVSEFDFRQNTREKLGFDDEMRTIEAIKSAKGKRLTYKPTKAQNSLT